MTHQKHNIYRGKILSNCISSKWKLLLCKRQCLKDENTCHVLEENICKACVWQRGVPRWLSGKESSCQCRRHKRLRFDSLGRKIPWSRKWQPTPVFLPGKFQWTEESGRLNMTDWLSTHTSDKGLVFNIY